MTRRLVPLQQIIDDVEEQGGDPSTLFADPDDIAELEPEGDQEQED